MFDCWADPVAHLLLLKSSVAPSMVSATILVPLVVCYPLHLRSQECCRSCGWENWKRGILILGKTKEHDPYLILNTFYCNLPFTFFKWANPGLFCLFSLFSLFSHYNFNNKNLKSIDGVLGIRTHGRRIVGADKTTELWRPPRFTLKLYLC